MNRFSNLLWFWTLLVIPVALLNPEIFLPLKPLIKPLLGSVILAMGLTLKASDFKFIISEPKSVIVGILSQYSFMPLFGFVFGLLFMKGFSKDFVAGQVLTGSCPTGVVSNVYNFIAQANVALSISLSAVNTFISPILTPIFTKVLAGKIVRVDFLKLFSDMVKVTLLPILIGISLNFVLKERIDRVKSVLPIYSTVCVVLIVGFVVASGHNRILSMSIISVVLMIIASFFHLLCGYVAGYVFSKILGLGEKESVTVSIETAMQNSGLATVLALSQWGSIAALPAITYSVVQNVVGPFVCSFFRRRIT
jgi:BASS family bile acid:Na+ symporter